MRAVAVVALVLCLLAVAVKADEPLTSLMELDSAMPSDLASASDAKILALHEAAGSFADEAIADAQRDSLLMETESATSVGNGRHWDDSVPEIHLHSTQPEETLSTALETVDHLDHVRPGLTAEAPSAVLSAFQQKISPAILGEDHVFIQHAAQTTQTAAADSSSEIQAVVVSDVNSEADSVTEAEAAQGVMTMSELEQMMELEGMSQQEIDQYMENLGEMTVDVEADAETATATESEADVEAEVEAEAAVAADSEAVQAVVVDVSAETDAESEAVQSVTVDAESDSAVEAESETEAEAETETEAAAETETETETETEAEADADSETETETEAEADADSESESEAEYKLSAEELAEIKAEAEAEVAQESPEQTVALLEADSESEAEAETEGSFDMELDAEAESDSEAEAETETESQDEVVHLAEHSVPAQLQESAPSTVTPLHSAAYTRAHPTLKRLASAPVASGYSLPQPVAMMETASKAREVDLEKYNPNAIQLGPSKDAYGYVPMTGAEFLNSNPRPVSLAQMSVQLQHQEGTWLPPPIEAEATPNYIVGVGGLRPNPNAGPYQGQYGLAAGGQSVHQETSFIQY